MGRLILLLTNLRNRWGEWSSPIGEGEFPRRLERLWSRNSSESTAPSVESQTD